MDILQAVLVPLIVVAVLVVVIVAVALLNRGKQLKCPKCGQVFKSPLMDDKMLGAGWTFPYLGTVKCPRCGVELSRREYSKVTKAAVAADSKP
jgi:uncharacterized C2H2 Zn-finger protein